jgi:hypothetical protein
MRATHLGAFLLGLGVAVGILAGLGLLLGLEPARLPAALLNVAAYKLTFLAAFGLLAAGAVVRRYAGRERTRAAFRARANESLQQTARHASGELLAAPPERSDPPVRAAEPARRS